MKLLAKKICTYIYALALLSNRIAIADTATAGLDNVFRHGSQISLSKDCRKTNKQLQCVRKKLNEIDSKLACQNAISFGSAEINQPGGFVIERPGYYCLEEDVIFSAPNPIMISLGSDDIITTVKRSPARVSAISINADHVVVDLNNHTLSQGNTVAAIAGIEIAPQHEDISIINGNIRGFTQAAIYSFIPNQVPQIFSSELLFQNLTIIGNGIVGQVRPETNDGTGISLQSPGAASSPVERTDYKYYDVTIDNCNINSNIGVAITAAQVNGLVIKDSHADNQFNRNPASVTHVLGLLMKNTVNVQLLNSTFNNSTIEGGNGLVIGGTRTSNCFNVMIDGCQFNGAQARGTTAVVILAGFQGGMNGQCLIQNSQFNNMFADRGTGELNGIHNSRIAGQVITSGGIEVINCQFNKLSAASGVPITAITLSDTRDLSVENCEFINYSLVPAASPTDAVTGIRMVFSNDIVLNDAIASILNITVKNCLMSQFNGGLVSGFQFTMPNVPAKPCQPPFPPCIPQIANVVLTENTIAKFAGAGTTFGILLRNNAVAETSPTFIFKNAAIRNNNIMDVRGATGSAGISIFNVKNPVLLNNVIEDCDTGILFNGSATTGFVNRGIVQNNYITSCTTGYQDTLNPTNSGWIDNTAVLNGTNYNIQWNGERPIDEGFVVAPYPKPGNKYYNISLI